MGKKIKSSSISAKMSLYTAMLITFLMCAVGFANYYYNRLSLQNQALDKGWSIVRSSTSFAAERMQSGNPELLHEHLQHVLANGDISYAALINAAGRVVAHTDGSLVGKPADIAGGLPSGNTVKIYVDSSGKPAGYDFVAPVTTKGGGILGYYRLGLDNTRFENMLREILYNTLLISLASVLAGIMLAKVLARHILKKPIEDLRAATEHIAAGDFTHRVPVRNMDELGSLASAFNIMTGHLANLFMSVRTSATELTRSSQLILNRSEDIRLATENSIWDRQSGKAQAPTEDSNTRRQLEALQDITLSAKKMSRLVDRLNALSLQFKL